MIVGGHAGDDLEIVVVQDDLDLVEVSDVDYFSDRNRPGGMFSISRRMLPSSDQGTAFLRLCAGSASIHRELIASGSATYTPNFDMRSLLAIRLLTSNLPLVEGVNFLVNWASGVITFTPAVTETAEIAYLSEATVGMIATPFVFDVVWRRREDKVTVRRLKSCAVYRITGSASGDEDTTLSGNFLSLEGEP